LADNAHQVGRVGRFMQTANNLIQIESSKAKCLVLTLNAKGSTEWRMGAVASILICNSLQHDVASSEHYLTFRHPMKFSHITAKSI